MSVPSLIMRFGQRLLDDPEIQRRASKWAREQMTLWDIPVPPDNSDALAECDLYYHLQAVYMSKLSQSISNYIGVQIAGVNKDPGRDPCDLSLPKAALDIYYDEEAEARQNYTLSREDIINSLNEHQAKQVIRAMLGDQCNQIDHDNWVHYFS